ncbi:hypothetical protein BTUL_0154g00010 [Botrytis tulipae]|uniref:Uncharacterized protein n=1 Tax=Botrytis tulipae TaxID=87230 RepID=A0A4Z1EH18_9HELO|nr:hypothetical protein BTUL_0154g00010 [Botrytis tulipae]
MKVKYKVEIKICTHTRMLIKYGCSRTLPYRRTVLKAHTFLGCKGTTLAIETLTFGTSRWVNSYALFTLFVEDSAGLATRLLLSDTLFAIKSHSGGTVGFFEIRAVLAIEYQSFITFRYGAKTDLAVEGGSSRTLGFIFGDTFAVQKGVTRLTVNANQADTPPIAPLVVRWAFGVLGADALFTIKDCSFKTGGNSNDTAASNQRRAWLALRDRGCDTFALTIGNETRATDGGDGGDTVSAIEGRIVRAFGEVESDTLLTVESAALFETLRNTGGGDALGTVEGEVTLADGLENADTHASLESGSGRATNCDSGNAVLTSECQSGRISSLLDNGTDRSF